MAIAITHWQRLFHEALVCARDCRNPYGNIASIVAMTPNAVKERINKMFSNGVIRSFVLRINPAILGYEKECILIY
jgi:DNA-binding Lrp family transcriptional regulator